MVCIVFLELVIIICLANKVPAVKLKGSALVTTVKFQNRRLL